MKRTRKQACKERMHELFGPSAANLVNYMTEEDCIRRCKRKVKAMLNDVESKKFDKYYCIKIEKRDYQAEILNYLKLNNNGTSISELSRSLDINRITLTKHLVCMQFLDLVDSKDINDRKRIWYPVS